MNLEPMDAFFAARVEGYDQHMRQNVDGGGRYYEATAKWLPKSGNVRVLDLGCGTGLELDAYFEINPDARITGIDITKEMTDILLQKHRERIDQIQIINASYFDVTLENNSFDAAVSVQTLHHFLDDDKTNLYRKIYQSLKKGARYVETDYMAPDQKTEACYLSEYKRLRASQSITDGFYHYDIPFTAAHQIGLLKMAGFDDVKKVWQSGDTCILVAQKKGNKD